MHCHRYTVVSDFCLATLAVLVFPSGWRQPTIRTAFPAGAQALSAQELMREVVRNELGGPNGPPIYWRYSEIYKKDGVAKLFEVCQTRGGTVRELVEINGKPLPPALQQQQQSRLDEILDNPFTARERARAHAQDGNKEAKLFAMLPNAFLFRYAGNDGNLVRLAFQPNPRFVPPTREAQVFHHMTGFVLVDPRQKRLAEINGRLITEVKFFWGLLGYLDQGGTFSVRRADVGGGHWELMRLKVNMQGEALLFKTIGVQENKRYEDYRRDSPRMTLQEAAQRLEVGASSGEMAAEAAGN